MEMKSKNSLVNRSVVYESGCDFYDLAGNVIMKLSPKAAMSVCKNAAKRGILIWRVEGGIKHSPSAEFPSGAFEARLDCIWDGPNPPVSVEEAEEINRSAYDFVEKESLTHNAFVITTAEIDKDYSRN